jgi:hypothetical protein
MRLAQLVPFLFLLPAAPSAAAQSPAPAPPAAAHDLRVESRAEQPLYAELRFEIKVAGEAGTGSKKKKLELRHETRLDYVDELVARDQPAPGDLDIRRTYLRWDQDLTFGRGKPTPTDNSFVGARTLITRRGNEIALELIDRLAPQKELEELLRHSASAIWPALPASARVGETCPVDPTGLVGLIVGDEFKARASTGTFTLRAVDAEGVATLDSPILVMIEDDEGRGTMEGSFTLAIDTRAKCVRSVDWKGSALLRMDDGEVQMSLKGTFEARLEVEAGDPARKALERRVVHRAVPRTLNRGPLTVELPSHWYVVEAEEGDEAETFRTTVHGAEAPFTLELQFFDVTSDEFDSAVDAAVKQIGKEFRLSSVKSVPSPLGKGRSMRFEVKGDGGAVSAFLLEFHPCGKNRMVRARLVGPEKTFDDELREWPAVLRTFELAK